MAIYTVRHITTYHYKEPVGFGEHRMMLAPREDHDQRLLDLNLEISPEPSTLRWSRDVYGNRIAIAHFCAKATTLRFVSTMRVEHSLSDIVDANIEDSARSYPFTYSSEDLPHLVQFIECHSADPHGELQAWTQNFLRAGATTHTRAVLVNLTHKIRETFKYVARHEKGIQEPRVTLERKSGSCRDMAVFMIEVVRALGLAARFVSGYLHVPSTASAGGQDRGGNTHAWLQVYLPGCGWVDFDPSSGIIGNRGLVRVAVVRDARQAIPLQGVWKGRAGDSLGMKVAVRVTSADEIARLGAHDGEASESGRHAARMPSEGPVPA
jgi:transglutaminase-like putative cysteine protease